MNPKNVAKDISELMANKADEALDNALGDDIFEYIEKLVQGDEEYGEDIQIAIANGMETANDVYKAAMKKFINQELKKI